MSDASDLTTLLERVDGGTINANDVTYITGGISDLNKVYGPNGISGLGDETITLNADTEVTASELKNLTA